MSGYQFISLKSDIAWLSGPPYFLASAQKQVLVSALERLVFKIYWLNGTDICNEQMFFDSVAASLGFPVYFGRNWDAFNDCAGDFDAGRAMRAALVWTSCNVLAEADLPAFAVAAHKLIQLSDLIRDDPQDRFPRQFEVFFLGDGEGFQRDRNRRED